MSSVSTNHNILSEPDESTLLLPDAEREGSSASSPSRGPTPLPKAQFGALVAVRIVDSIAYTQIFPYINQLIADLGIAAPEQVGFYTGFIGSAYSLAQVFSVYQWGRLSDIIGRRPVTLLSLFGTAVMTISFGWSTSLATIVASRFIGGLVAGNVAVLHSMLVEMTDDTNHNIAIPIYSLSSSAGTVIGPLIGGTFSNAAIRYPKYFSWPAFVDHPHLAPCVISAVCTLLGICFGYFFMEETLPSRRKGSTSGTAGRKLSGASDVEPGSTETASASVKTLLAIPALRALTLSGMALGILCSAFDVVFTLFCYTSVNAGGLGLHPSTIGNLLAFAGIFAVLIRLVAMPYILRRFDYAKTYNACVYLWPFIFAALPLFNALALSRPPAHYEIPAAIGTDSGAGIGTATAADISIWIGLALILALSKVAEIPCSITMLLINRHAPTPTPASVGVPGSGYTGLIASGCGSTCAPAIGAGTGTQCVTAAGSGSGSALGQSNGLVQLAMCVGSMIGPVVVSTLFTAFNGWAWARRWGIGWTWSLVMVCFAVVGARVTRGIR